MSEDTKKIYVAALEQAGRRIDLFLGDENRQLSRSYIQTLIKEKHVFVNGIPAKSSYKLKVKDEILIEIPEPEELNMEAEDIPLDILYEDSDLLIVNKGKGMVVHPAAGHSSGTLVNALLYHCKDNLSGINGILRPGIVHRIDQDTTGALVVCKNDTAHNFLAEQLKIHSITRKYNALVYGNIKNKMETIDAPVGRHPNNRKKMSINPQNGKRAVTHCQLLDNLGTHFASVECTLETGRTHQIRVHMASIHHPLVGDTTYGPGIDPFHLQGQALHARVLGFIHPRTKQYLEVEAPLPEYFFELMDKLKKK